MKGGQKVGLILYRFIVGDIYIYAELKAWECLKRKLFLSFIPFLWISICKNFTKKSLFKTVKSLKWHFSWNQTTSIWSYWWYTLKKPLKFILNFHRIFVKWQITKENSITLKNEWLNDRNLGFRLRHFWAFNSVYYRWNY